MGKKQKYKTKRANQRSINDAWQYHSKHEAWLKKLKKSRYGLTHSKYGFPLLLKDNVCPAHPDMSHASGIVIDNLPHDFFQKDVLDVGCGSGVIALSAAYRKANVIACDNSSAAIALTKENIRLNSAVSRRITVIESDLFNGINRELPNKKYDYILANLWFPVAMHDNHNDVRDALNCYERFFKSVRNMLTPQGVACLVSNSFADTTTTKQMMSQNGIRPHIKSVQKRHFDCKVAVNWNLYSFDKQGQPAKLNRQLS